MLDKYKEYYLIVFNSKNYAYQIESFLKKLKSDTELLQAPKYLSKGCNFALKFKSHSALEKVMNKIGKENGKVYRIYKHHYDHKKNKSIYKIVYK